MNLTVSFDLARLSDERLRVFVAGSFEGKRLESPIVRSIQTCLLDETRRRNQVRAGLEACPVTLELPALLEPTDIFDAATALTADCISLEKAAKEVMRVRPDFADELNVGAEFLFCVWQVLVNQANAHRIATAGPIN